MTDLPQPTPPHKFINDGYSCCRVCSKHKNAHTPQPTPPEPKNATVTISAMDVPEVRQLIAAVIALPPRWSDGCGECAWCRLDLAIADLGIVPDDGGIYNGAMS